MSPGDSTVPSHDRSGSHDAPVPGEDLAREVSGRVADEATLAADARVGCDIQPCATRRRRLRLRLSVATQEAIRSLADTHGVSEAGLLDALFHGLENADQDWLDGVTERARRMDAHYRSQAARTGTGDAPQASCDGRSSGA